MKTKLTVLMLAIASLAFLSGTQRATGQTPAGTAFTYQGHLVRDGMPVNGNASFQFLLYDSETGGTNLGSVGFTSVPVANGVFSVQLDFEAHPFGTSARWLEIVVQQPPGIGEATFLSPRQPLGPAPYALQTRGIHVDAFGRVGIGTSSPQTTFHVVNEPVDVPAGVFSSDDVIIASHDAELALYSTRDGSWGSAVTLAEIHDGALDVNGDIQCVDLHETSDRRLKTNIAPLTRGLDRILELRGVHYDWKLDEFPELELSDRKQVGFIAQEVANVVPEAVRRDEHGTYSLNYGRVVPVLVEAVKELHSELEEKNAQMAERDAQIDALSLRLQRLEAMVERSIAGGS